MRNVYSAAAQQLLQGELGAQKADGGNRVGALHPWSFVLHNHVLKYDGLRNLDGEVGVGDIGLGPALEGLHDLPAD